MAIATYSSGQVAKQVSPEDGTGFLFYPSGKTAASITCASDYQNAHFAFDSNSKGKPGLLLAIDENLVGFASSTARPQGCATLNPDGSPCITTLVLSKVGGLVTVNGGITHDWLWAKQPELPETLTFSLNESFAVSLKSKSLASLTFTCEGTTHSMDLSVKQRRKLPAYTATAKWALGKLVPSLPNHQTLKQRTSDFNLSMRAQNNKIHPKSTNLSPMVAPIVSSLEATFDDNGGISQRMVIPPNEGNWKELALSTTLRYGEP